MTRSGPSVVVRAQRLLITGVAVPVVGVLLIHLVYWRLGLVGLLSFMVWEVFAGLAVYCYSRFRNKVNYWHLASLGSGGAMFVTIFVLLSTTEVPGWDTAPRSLAVIGVLVAVTLGLAVLSLQITARAIRLLLKEMSHDVVTSSLIFVFRTRGVDPDIIFVTPETIDLVRRREVEILPSRTDKDSLNKVELSYLLTDVCSATVRHQDSETEYYPVPGSRTRKIRVTQGDYVEIDLSGFKFVFPAVDSDHLAQLVEGRARALAGDR